MFRGIFISLGMIISKVTAFDLSRGVNVRPNPRTRHEPDTGFSGLGLGLNGFGS